MEDIFQLNHHNHARQIEQTQTNMFLDLYLNISIYVLVTHPIDTIKYPGKSILREKGFNLDHSSEV